MIKNAAILLGVILVFSSVSYSYADHHMAPSPKHQMNNGVSAEDVQCNVGFQLMIKYTGEAACVKPSSASKLVAADWGTIQGEVVTELPAHEEESMELEENVSIEEETSESDEEEKASYKVELSESMAMGN